MRVLLDADLWHFAILTSRMHMAWLRWIGGRLESRYRYSIGIIDNTFPWPTATEAQRAKVRSLGQAVLDARKQFPGSTLADLYDVDAMPPQLRQAHRALDAGGTAEAVPFPCLEDVLDFGLARRKQIPHCARNDDFI